MVVVILGDHDVVLLSEAITVNFSWFATVAEAENCKVSVAPGKLLGSAKYKPPFDWLFPPIVIVCCGKVDDAPIINIFDSVTDNPLVPHAGWLVGAKQ